jgi:hypothetical protein
MWHRVVCRIVDILVLLSSAQSGSPRTASIGPCKWRHHCAVKCLGLLGWPSRKPVFGNSGWSFRVYLDISEICTYIHTHSHTHTHTYVHSCAVSLSLSVCAVSSKTVLLLFNVVLLPTSLFYYSSCCFCCLVLCKVLLLVFHKLM